MSTRPPISGDFVAHHVHADAAAGNLGHRLGGRQAGGEDELGDLAFGRLSVGGQEAHRGPPATKRFQVQARAVVGEDQRNLVAFLAQRDRDAPALRLCRRRRARPDPRSRAPGRCAACARGARRCARARRGRARPRRRSISSSAFLPISRAIWRTMRYRRSLRFENGTARTRIRSCCTSRLVRAWCSSAASVSPMFLCRRLLDRHHVVQALGHQPGELLQARIAVELERVELALLLVHHRQARLHLAVGLDFDLAQLVAQARDALREVGERLLDRRAARLRRASARSPPRPTSLIR